MSMQDTENDASQAQGGREGMQAQRKKWINFGDFETMDTEPARVALSPKRLAWAENVMIIANNDLRAVPGVGSVLTTLSGKTIVKRFFAYVHGIDYIVCFNSDGSCIATDVATGSQSTIAGPGTFSTSPDMTQWEDTRILIGDTTGGYCTWDGTLFITQGNVSPNITITGGGEDYATAPTVTISGGTGSGATATATITDGHVTEITLTNAGTGYAFDDILLASFSGGTPLAGGVIAVTVLDGGFGYLHNPTLTFDAPVSGGVTATATAQCALGRIVSITITNAGSGYLETPAIAIAPTGGDTISKVGILTPTMDTVASAEVRIWPFTLAPSTLAVYQGRVWLAKVREMAYTGTLGYDDVDEINAAGSTTLQDADVVHYITKLLSANNFLYIVCDQSIKQIGTISVSGTLTNFNITTLSSDQGTIYPDTVKSYNRSVVFLNDVGVFGIFGASVEKISAPMTGVVERIDFGLNPVLDVYDFYGHHVLLCLVRYTDPDVGARSIMMAYYQKRWSVMSQGDSITGIVTAHLAGPEKFYSTENGVIKQILADQSVQVHVLLLTALAHNNEPQIGKRAVRIAIGLSSQQPNIVNASIDSENGEASFSYTAGRSIVWVNNSNATITWQNNSLATIQWVSGGYVYYETLFQNQSGIYIGASIEGDFSNFRFNNITIEYVHAALMKSRNIG